MGFRQLFHSELMPLHPNSQQVIAQKIPKELDLDKWIGSPFPDSSDSEDSFLENIEDQDPNDWYSDGGKDKVTTKKDKNFIKQQSVARKQRQIGPWYIGDDDDQTNEQKLSTSDIENADIEEIDSETKIEVHSKNKLRKVDKNKIPKHLRGKKYTVIIKKNKNNKIIKGNDDYLNPLSLDIDLSQPIDPQEMPSIKPYSQKDIVYVQEKEKNDDDHKKKEKKKKKHKKEKKQSKKEKKRQKKAEKQE